jgi:hypothetical protein
MLAKGRLGEEAYTEAWVVFCDFTITRIIHKSLMFNAVVELRLPF